MSTKVSDQDLQLLYEAFLLFLDKLSPLLVDKFVLEKIQNMKEMLSDAKNKPIDIILYVQQLPSKKLLELQSQQLKSSPSKIKTTQVSPEKGNNPSATPSPQTDTTLPNQAKIRLQSAQQTQNQPVIHPTIKPTLQYDTMTKPVLQQQPQQEQSKNQLSTQQETTITKINQMDVNSQPQPETQRVRRFPTQAQLTMDTQSQQTMKNKIPIQQQIESEPYQYRSTKQLSQPSYTKEMEFLENQSLSSKFQTPYQKQDHYKTQSKYEIIDKKVPIVDQVKSLPQLDYFISPTIQSKGQNAIAPQNIDPTKYRTDRPQLKIETNHLQKNLQVVKEERQKSPNSLKVIEKKLSTNSITRKNRDHFQKIQSTILQEIQQASRIFQNNTVTLICVYNKSFEISSPSIKEQRRVDVYETKFVTKNFDEYARLAEMQLTQKNFDLKDFTIYQKKEKTETMETIHTKIDAQGIRKKIIV